jgi:CubicO group peptidase (beta-lactamase class C family)
MMGEYDLVRIVDSAGYPDDGVIAVAVVGGDDPPVLHARGLLPDGRAISASTLVYGASLTKQLVATCIARLASAGRIDVDQPIAGWFPDFPGWTKEIRVRHLLHHTAGLPDEDPLKARMRELGLTKRTNDTMLKAISSYSQLMSRPGEEHRYSNVGYVMLARIIEITTGVALATHVKTTIFEPLGMTQSLLWSGPARYPAGANGLDPNVLTPHSVGDGGMWTSADDMTRWIQAMYDDAFGTRDLIMTKAILNDGSPFDYAWGIAVTNEHGTNVCTHGGGWPGSYSLMSWIPERRTGFVAFTITGGEPLNQVSQALRRYLCAAY